MTVIVLSAGGTGGHLFPAQALAGELAKRGKTIVVMTDARGHNYASAFPGARIETIPSAAFADRSLARRIAAPFQIAAGVALAFAKLLKLKPGVVVGFGGYPSLPVMLAATLTKFPTAILEQNTVMGRVNRLVMDRVRAIAGAFPIARFAPKDASKVVLTGNPVRPDVLALAGAPYEMPDAHGGLRLLVFGGSQGARAFSELIPGAIKLLPGDMRARLELVQQCRAEDLEGVRKTYASASVKAELAPFFSDMPKRIANAHLVIGRSGAGTVSELAVIGRPSILIPLPYAMDDHQTTNAEILVKAGAAWSVSQRDLTPDMLAKMLIEAFSWPEKLAERAAAARSVARPDATLRLADLVERLAEAA